jgi:hypothetical protein
MKIQLAVICGILVLAAACVPATPALPATTPSPQATQIGAPAGEGLAPTNSPANETPLTAATTETETPEETAPLEPTATPTEWEQVQRTIESYRNRLDRGSDGYQGLTVALEQVEPNQAWCGGLGAAIGDFAYANDEESAQALRDLQDTQGCN